MSTFIKLTGSRQPLYLRPKFLDQVTTALSANYLSLRLGNPKIETSQGKEATLENGVLKPNQSVLVSFGTVQPMYYDVLLSVNPLLCKTCLLSCPILISPSDEPVELSFLLTAVRQTDISNLDWWISLSMVE